jgi:23S rRNA pseudouridine2605 synthase
MAKEENEKPRRTRTAKPKSEQAPEGESFQAPAQKGPKHFSFGPARSASDAPFDKPRRERSSEDRPRRSAGDAAFDRKPRKRSDGEQREERKFDKPRFGDRKPFRSEESSDRPKRRRSDDDKFSEPKPRFGSGDDSDKPRRRSTDGDRPFESRPRFHKADSGDRPFRKRSDSDRDAEPRRFGSRDRFEKPFRQKSEEGESGFKRRTAGRDENNSERPARRNFDKPGFEIRETRSDKPRFGAERGERRSNDDKPSRRPERLNEKRNERGGAERKTRDDFKTSGEWLDPEDFKAELKNSRGRRKENDTNDLGYRPDYIPAPKREYRKPSTSKPTLESKDGKIRLNKYIANAGICSRREADELIQSGAVKVNGEIITTLGFRVSPIDKIQYGDQTLTREKKQYLLLNKPKDYITTANDPEGRKTVMELVKDACRERLYPVGRLDRATTGLLLMTNDGELAKRLMHPSHEMRKVYHVTLNKNLKAVDLKKISEGLDLEDGRAEVDEVAWAAQDNKMEIGIVLHSGKNRIVRRIFEHLGYEVTKLDRTGLAGLTKKNLPRGKYRFLTDKELIMLRMG